MACVTVTPELVERLRAYYQLLARWNRKINLTSVNLEELPADAVDRLFIEPLAAARLAPSDARIIDVGSGGGSPAIPFALAAKAASLVMVESRTRKSVFLQEAARAVALQARVITARYEDAAERRELRNAFEVVTLRAVRVDDTTLQRLVGFCSSDGSIFLFQTAALAQPAGMGVKTHQLTKSSILQIVTPHPSVPRGT